MSERPNAPARPPAGVLPVRLTRADDGYALCVKPGRGLDPAAAYDRDERTVTVRSDGTAADLANRLKLAAELIDTAERADAALQEYVAVCGLVESLGPLVEAALPAADPVARRFWKAMHGLADCGEPPAEVLADALDAFDTLPVEERRRILNGWTPAAERPAYADVLASGEHVTLHRVMELGVGGRRHAARWEYRLDDAAGLYPVRVLLTEGVSKRDVLDALRDFTELVAAAWGELVGGDTPPGEPIAAADAYFRPAPSSRIGPANEKGEAPQTPAVPEPGSNRNDKGTHAKPAA